MRTKEIKTAVLLTILCLGFSTLSSYCYAQSDKGLFEKSMRASQEGNLDIAFSYLHMLLNEFPDSPFYPDALFASAEYYFNLKDYTNARGFLNELIDNFPNSKATPFALTYLIKIAETQDNPEQKEKTKKALIGLEQLSLLFRDYKELFYRSAFSKNYKALYFIDKIEIYINDKLFNRVSF